MSMSMSIAAFVVVLLLVLVLSVRCFEEKKRGSRRSARWFVIFCFGFAVTVENLRTTSGSKFDSDFENDTRQRFCW